MRLRVKMEAEQIVRAQREAERRKTDAEGVRQAHLDQIKFQVPKGVSSKLFTHWKGPYQIMEQTGPLNYKIRGSILATCPRLRVETASTQTGPFKVLFLDPVFELLAHPKKSAAGGKPPKKSNVGRTVFLPLYTAFFVLPALNSQSVDAKERPRLISSLPVVPVLHLASVKKIIRMDPDSKETSPRSSPNKKNSKETSPRSSPNKKNFLGLNRIARKIIKKSPSSHVLRSHIPQRSYTGVEEVPERPVEKQPACDDNCVCRRCKAARQQKHSSLHREKERASWGLSDRSARHMHRFSFKGLKEHIQWAQFSRPILERKHSVTENLQPVVVVPSEDVRTMSAAKLKEKLDKDSMWRHKLVIVLVGLPARGKSYLGSKVVGFLKWQGIQSKMFNCGSYRRELFKGEKQDAEFFATHRDNDKPDDNHGGGQTGLEEIAMAVLDHLLDWLATGGEVAVFDATNSTYARRRAILAKCAQRSPRLPILFVESICRNPEQLRLNLMQKVAHSPDYKDMSIEEALADLQKRIQNYESRNQEVGGPEEDGTLSYIKLMDTMTHVVCNRIHGRLQNMCVQFFMSIHLKPRPIYLARTGGHDLPASQQKPGKSPKSTNMLQRRLFKSRSQQEMVPLAMKKSRSTQEMANLAKSPKDQEHLIPLNETGARFADWLGAFMLEEVKKLRMARMMEVNPGRSDVNFPCSEPATPNALGAACSGGVASGNLTEQAMKDSFRQPGQGIRSVDSSLATSPESIPLCGSGFGASNRMPMLRIDEGTRLPEPYSATSPASQPSRSSSEAEAAGLLGEWEKGKEKDSKDSKDAAAGASNQTSSQQAQPDKDKDKDKQGKAKAATPKDRGKAGKKKKRNKRGSKSKKAGGSGAQVEDGKQMFEEGSEVILHKIDSSAARRAREEKQAEEKKEEERKEKERQEKEKQEKEKQDKEKQEKEKQEKEKQEKQIVKRQHSRSQSSASGFLLTPSSSLAATRSATAPSPSKFQGWVDAPLHIFVSTAPRGVQTVEPVMSCVTGAEMREELSLRKMDMGVCHGLSFEEFKQIYPQEHEAWTRDKFQYRFPGGESQKDLALHVLPVVLEMERQHEPVLVVSHLSTLQVVYGYFLGASSDEYWDVTIPTHTLIRMEPHHYGWKETRFHYREQERDGKVHYLVTSEEIAHNTKFYK
eukprot:g33826.t1